MIYKTGSALKSSLANESSLATDRLKSFYSPFTHTQSSDDSHLSVNVSVILGGQLAIRKHSLNSNITNQSLCYLLQNVREDQKNLACGLHLRRNKQVFFFVKGHSHNSTQQRVTFLKPFWLTVVCLRFATGSKNSTLAFCTLGSAKWVTATSQPAAQSWQCIVSLVNIRSHSVRYNWTLQGEGVIHQSQRKRERIHPRMSQSTGRCFEK